MNYKTSMITDEEPLQELLFYKDLGFSHTLHVLKERRQWASQNGPFSFVVERLRENLADFKQKHACSEIENFVPGRDM